jgi:predicted DNA-binding transcriptional regulator YafY
MPVSKEALIRYRIINQKLINRKFVTLREIKEACEDALDKAPISERTIMRDIDAMRNDRHLGWFAPIIYDHLQKAYRYEDFNYSIDRLPLKEEEMDALFFAARMLQQFKDVEIFRQVNGAIQKISDHIRIRKNLKEDEFSEFIDFEKVTEFRGHEYLGALIQAISKKRAVRITYKAFQKDRSFTHIFHPYLLKEYRNRWYVFGLNEYWNGLRIYALDRISGIEPIPGHDYIKSDIPPGDYFKNIIGVTNFEGTAPEKVLIRLSKQQAPYVLTQPLHESQQVVEEADDYTIISLEVHNSPELMIILLGWGEEIEVLEPAELRNNFRKIHERSAEKHRDRQIVYFDMDGVLADFQSGIDQLSDDMKEKFKGHEDDAPGIFKTLKPYPAAIDAFHRISSKYDCFVLTTAPWNNPTSPNDKREWLKKHLGEAVDRKMIISHRKDLNCGSYLIDDRDKHGAAEFRGKHIHFGKEKFPDWETVYEFLRV